MSCLLQSMETSDGECGDVRTNIKRSAVFESDWEDDQWKSRMGDRTGLYYLQYLNNETKEIQWPNCIFMKEFPLMDQVFTVSFDDPIGKHGRTDMDINEDISSDGEMDEGNTKKCNNDASPKRPSKGFQQVDYFLREGSDIACREPLHCQWEGIMVHGLTKILSGPDRNKWGLTYHIYDGPVNSEGKVEPRMITALFLGIFEHEEDAKITFKYFKTLIEVSMLSNVFKDFEDLFKPMVLQLFSDIKTRIYHVFKANRTAEQIRMASRSCFCGPGMFWGSIQCNGCSSQWYCSEEHLNEDKQRHEKECTQAKAVEDAYKLKIAERKRRKEVTVEINSKVDVGAYATTQPASALETKLLEDYMELCDNAHKAATSKALVDTFKQLTSIIGKRKRIVDIDLDKFAELVVDAILSEVDENTPPPNTAVPCQFVEEQDITPSRLWSIGMVDGRLMKSLVKLLECDNNAVFSKWNPGKTGAVSFESSFQHLLIYLMGPQEVDGKVRTINAQRCFDFFVSTDGAWEACIKAMLGIARKTAFSRAVNSDAKNSYEKDLTEVLYFTSGVLCFNKVMAEIVKKHTTETVINDLKELLRLGKSGKLNPQSEVLHCDVLLVQFCASINAWCQRVKVQPNFFEKLQLTEGQQKDFYLTTMKNDANVAIAKGEVELTDYMSMDDICMLKSPSQGTMVGLFSERVKFFPSSLNERAEWDERIAAMMA